MTVMELIKILCKFKMDSKVCCVREGTKYVPEIYRSRSTNECVIDTEGFYSERDHDLELIEKCHCKNAHQESKCEF